MSLCLVLHLNQHRLDRDGTEDLKRQCYNSDGQRSTESLEMMLTFLLVTSYFLLVTCYFLLVTRHFLLVTHYFLLVTRYFLLVTFLFVCSLLFIFLTYYTFQFCKTLNISVFIFSPSAQLAYLP